MKLSEIKCAVQEQLEAEMEKSLDAEIKGLDAVVKDRMEKMSVFELLEMLEYMDVG